MINYMYLTAVQNIDAQVSVLVHCLVKRKSRHPISIQSLDFHLKLLENMLTSIYECITFWI